MMNTFRLNLILIVIIALLIISSIWSYTAFLEMEDASDRIVEDAVPVSNAANDLLTQLVNQDTAVRGFIITEESRYLDPYYDGKAALLENLAIIDRYEEQHPIMKDIIEEEALPKINNMRVYFERQINLVKSGQMEQAREQINDGKSTMDSFRETDLKIDQDNNKIINDAWEASNRAGARAKNMIIFSGAAALTAVGALIYSFMSNRKLTALSSFDGLTKLYNRRMFDKFMKEAWEEAADTQQSLAVMLMDVDHFKLYNDTYGHVEGDRCLKTIASILAENAGSPFIPARYGGEEFVVIMPNTTAEEANAAAERIRHKVESASLPHIASLSNRIVTISAGAAAFVPDTSLSPSDLIEMADEALYEAKQGGRNRVSVSRQSVS
ncbi:diguanylate cyclase [Domibacillus enclensis]|uniref:GGDEF domain-containing protein n=2 Tax=Domibacillus enclensis TaxID=1017273 RepID=A0ABX4ECA2_9BACI|nr:diguanylate cyclase [Domibacillus enclensis]OXS80046.1 hypothetical protein B1B05_00755 [Domibacillus enclensis]